MKRIITLLPLLALMGQEDCKSTPPPGNFYCHGAVNESALEGKAADIYVEPGMYQLDYPDGRVVGPVSAAEAAKAFEDAKGDVEVSPWEAQTFVVIEDGSLLDDFLDELREFGNWTYTTIVGGVPSTDRRSTVYVLTVNTGSCSGVIIGPHTVLTAGHCNGPDGYRVYLDRNVPNYFQAIASYVHPGYYRWSTNRGEPHDDLMLLYFAETLPLPYAGGFYDGAKYTGLCEGMTAQGWGQTEDKNDPAYVSCPSGLSKCLRESPYTVFLESPTEIRTKQLTPGGICFGDSGGPLYAYVKGQPEPFLAGITSTTASTDCKVSATHVKVSAYKDWIIQNFEGPP